MTFFHAFNRSFLTIFKKNEPKIWKYKKFCVYLPPNSYLNFPIIKNKHNEKA